MSLLKSDKYQTATSENDFKVVKQKKYREDKSLRHPPAKYDNKIISHREIPINSIVKLVYLMDSDNDMKLTRDDLINFSHKHFVFFDESVIFNIYIFFIYLLMLLVLIY